jgi:hypothetical protein
MRRLLFIFLIALWLAGVSTGMSLLWKYNHVAGAPATPSSSWPPESHVQRATDKHTLIMLAHPKCPCTRASVEELSKLMAYGRGRLRAYVLFLKPQDYPEGWSKTDLWLTAASIPGVTVLVDKDGIEANRFGASTSGQVLLYDQNGRLEFRGGITESRGHSGDNAGRAAVEALVNGGVAARDQTPVFGCPLFDPDSECRRPNHAIRGN